MRKRLMGAAAACGLALALAACSGPVPKHETPLSFAIKREMDLKGVSAADPIMMRIFKEESKLEVWKRTKTGKYVELKSYDICRWSGDLGPKRKEGDKQAPEGYYQVTRGLMNPKSSYHLSFNLGYPNAFDQSHGRTGAHLMVHGDCLSAGCYAMQDKQIEEIYALAREAFDGGQRAIQVQAYPFRMTPENLARHRNNPNAEFWKNLKEGNDHFEVTGAPPSVDVCGRRYVFNAKNEQLDPAAPCPQLEVASDIRTAVAQKAQQDEQAIQLAVARLENGGTVTPTTAPVQVAATRDTTVATSSTASSQDSPSLMSRLPALRIPGLGGRKDENQGSAATGYAPVDGNAPDPFAVFDMFVTVDTRSVPRSHVKGDAAGTR